MLPGAVEQAEADAPTMAVEGPSVAQWQFDSALAKRIRHPLLYLGGTESAVQFREARGLVHSWFPQTEDVEVPGANHHLQCHSPQSASLVAEGIAAFLARHPFS